MIDWRFDWKSVPRIREHTQLGGRPAWFNGWGVGRVAVDPRGRWILTCGAAGLRLFHASSGELVRTFEGRGSDSQGWDAIAFSADGREAFARVGGALEEGTIAAWDVETGAITRTFAGPAGHISAFDTERRFCLSRGAKAEAVLWDVASGTVARTLAPRPDGGLGAAAFVAGGLVVGANSTGRGARCWEVETGRVVWERAVGAAYAMAAPREGAWFAAGARDELSVHDASTGELRFALPPPPGPVSSISISDDGRRLVASSDRLVSLYDLETRALLWTTRVGDARLTVASAAFAPGGAWIAAASTGGVLRRLDSGSMPPAAAAPLTPAIMAVAAFGGDGVISAAGTRVTVWRGTERTAEFDVEIPVWCLAAHGDQVLAGGETGARLFRMDGTRLRELSSAPIRSVSFQGGLANVVERAAELAGFDAEGEAIRYTETPEREGILRIGADTYRRRIDPDFIDQGLNSAVAAGEHVLAMVGAYDVYAWKRGGPRRGEQVEVGSSPGANPVNRATAIALHAGGKLAAIATNRWDAPIELWDLDAMTPVAILHGHEAPPLSLAFEGDRLVSGGEDRTVRVWRVGQGAVPVDSAPG